MTQAVAPPPAGEVALKAASVLVVDDEKGIRRVFKRMLTQEGYTVEVAEDGVVALAKVEQAKPDVVLLDVEMPGLDGFEVCRRLKRDSATRLTPVILVTTLTTSEQRVAGRRTGADDYLNKPVDADELLARVGAAVRLKRYTDDLDSAASIIMTLAEMIEQRDGYTEGHCHRMANYACTIGRRLGLGADDLQALHRGGFLHDIGMLAIPEAIVRKVQPLEPEEFELVKAHTVRGDELLANLRSLQNARPIVRHHHERFDGSGYPDGLCGDAIPLLAQIMSVADVFDTVTTKRSHQDATSVTRAIAALRHEADRGWRRRDLVEEFITAVAAKLAM